MCTRLPFGLHAAPLKVQAIVDRVLAPYPKAGGFVDDINIKGHVWYILWEDALEVLIALAREGFMLNLRKCKFLTPEAVLLGLQVFHHSYRLSDKCIKSWLKCAIPTSIHQL